VIRRLLTGVPPSFEPGPGRIDGGGLRFTFLGTAGFVVSSAERTFAIDPYVSRANLRTTVFGRLAIDEGRIARHVPSADEVLVGHSHYDHALDAPAVARHTGARLVGSSATAHIARAYGFDMARFVEVRAGDTVDCGAARATAIESRHGRAFLGRVPFPGDIVSPPSWPPRASELRHGAVFHWLLETAGTRVLHVDTADFFDDRLARADVLLLCAAGRQYRRDYTRRLLSIVRPEIVVPCHWDDFSIPVEAPPRQLPGVDVEGFVEEIRSGGARAVVLAPLQSWSA
jgi:L-ascorbate metabolism protein UlaG (beta-lactamase superfamily)